MGVMKVKFGEKFLDINNTVPQDMVGANKGFVVNYIPGDLFMGSTSAIRLHAY